MLKVSRRLNPECVHRRGDMRRVRLNERFDAVLVHDAVMYMLNERDLRAAMATAWHHLVPGGVALFFPDWVKETFVARTDHGGGDGDGVALRYLEWCWDPDPEDTTSLTQFVYVLRRGEEPVQVVPDRHEMGLFARSTWMELLSSVGFRATCVSLPRGIEPGGEDVFVGRRPRRR